MKQNKFFIIILLIILFSAPNVFARKSADIAGTYELQGVMEMAGYIRLKPDHTYIAEFSYGAADWIEVGVWKEEDGDIVISSASFKIKNSPDIQLIIPSGTRFKREDGRLVTGDSSHKLVFVDPNKTPSRREKAGEAGEGRMLVRGTVIKLDSRELVVKSDDCIFFDVTSLSPEVIKKVKGKQGKFIEAEIPYSAITAGGSCP